MTIRVKEDIKHRIIKLMIITWRCVIVGLEAISNKVYNDNNISAIQGTVAPKVNKVNTQSSVSTVVKNERQSDFTDQQDKGQTEFSEEKLMNAINKANNQMKPHRTRFEFSYHEVSRRVSIKVRDKETDEVIREIPPEEAIEMLEKLWEIAGFLVDERR